MINSNWRDNFTTVMKTSDLFSNKLIEQRNKQFDLYLKLSHINNIVKVLLEIKIKNKLTTKFEFLENIAESELVSYVLIASHPCFNC